MKDLTVRLENRPGALAEFGETLGRAGVPLLGGGAWIAGDVALAHFLVEDDVAAEAALIAAGITLLAVRPVVVQQLKQGTPGQLGKLARRMAEAGVNIEAQYSDHDHRLILVVDEVARATEVAAAWEAETHR